MKRFPVEISTGNSNVRG